MAVIIGDNPTERFTIVSKDISENKDLSWECRGLLIYLLGKPKNWKVSVSHLQKEGNSGRDKLYKMIKQLIDAGHIVRVQARKDGKADGWDYIVYSVPQHTENTDLEVQHTEFQEAENQCTEMRALISTDNKQELNTNNTYVETPVSPKKSKKYSDDDYCIAQHMFGLIQLLKPNFKQPNFESWANVIRLMREKDNRDYQSIKEVFEWANKDQFWCTNILSPEKLRKKFDQLEMKMLQEYYHEVPQFRDKPARKESFVDQQRRQAKKALASLGYGDGSHGNSGVYQDDGPVRGNVYDQGDQNL